MDAKTVIEMQPEWPKGYLRKGKALAAKFKYIEAKDAYAEGLTKDADDALLQAGYSHRARVTRVYAMCCGSEPLLCACW